MWSCAGSGHDPLVETNPEPPGSHCADGGIAIDVGLDKNDNGTLDPDEVTSITYVCDTPTTPPTPTPAELVAVVPEPAGAHCADGGTAIETGPDTNGNGTLDPSEVTSTSYVCAGARTLIRVVPEPVGANCTYGGQAIEVGVDTNVDDILETSEVTSTSYVCAGRNVPTLVRIDVESAGANCAQGGDAIHSGLDTNGDGILQDSEIQSTAYVCDLTGVFVGDFVITDETDVIRLTGITTITGSLDVEAPTLTSIALPDLLTVGGQITIDFGAPMLSSFSLPNLVSAHEIAIEGFQIQSVDLSSLQSVDTEITLESAPVTAFSLPALQTGYVTLDFDSSLSELVLPALVSGGIEAQSDALLATIEAPMLVTGGLNLTFNAALTSVSAPVMTTMAGFVIDDDAALAQLSFPAVTTVTGGIETDHDAVLAVLDLPALVATPTLEALADPMLPTCAVVVLGIQAHAATVTATGDDDAATCP